MLKKYLNLMVLNVKAADIEVDGQRILNSYTITNPKYGKGWKIRIEADDSPSLGYG